MSAALVGVIFTTVAAAMSFFSAPEFFRGGRIRVAAVWIVAAACAFFIPGELAGLAAAGAALLLTAPAGNVNRVIFYIAIFPALPHFYAADIPFPGLNYLINIDFAKLAAVVLLGPAFVAAVNTRTTPLLRTIDRLLLIYVLMTGVMTIRDLPFTSMMRATLDQFILVFMPYIAISRTLKTQEDVENALKALFAGVVILAFIALISSLRSWNYYANIADSINFKVYTDYRNGLLRINSTLVPTLLAFLMSVGVAAALWLRANKAQPQYFIYGLLALFGFAAFATGSRGGWLAGLLVVFLYYWLPRLNPFMRSLLIGSLIVAAVAGLAAIGQGADIINDKYGTFNYRADLLRTSFQQIADRPLFGSSDFIDSQRFAHLRQGEGIIDLVNGYLQITLYYGLFGLALYLGANALALQRALSILNELTSRRDGSENNAPPRRTVSLLIAMHVGLLAMLTTVSAVSYVWNYGFLILGLMAAQIQIRAASPAPADASPAGGAQNHPSPPSGGGRSGRPPPYGARFVRRI